MCGRFLQRFLPGLLVAFTAIAQAESQPNILWLSCEDIGTHLGSYGDPHAVTPNLDTLAERGWRYSHAFTIAPVCAPNRASVITGVSATTLGTHNMRSGGQGIIMGAEYLPKLPESIVCFPTLLREAGYYCTNNSKEDYNFVRPEGVWDKSSGRAHWRDRAEGQPFFAVFNYTGTHESRVWLDEKAHARNTEALTPEQRQDPDQVTPPPYHPNTAPVRQQWANYHENITALDHWVQDHLDALDEAGVAENTIVIFWSDHGAGLPRAKRWPYDSGTRVPLIVYVPEALRVETHPEPGAVVAELVSSIDLAPTTLKLAGIEPPDFMQGRSFLHDPAPQYVFSFRNRMDERIDYVRSVRDARFRYLRNYMPWQPYRQHVQYAEQSPVTQELRRLHEAGELPDGCAWWGLDRKPVEELYDTIADPHELNNLASDPEYQEVLKRMRTEEQGWCLLTDDLGRIPEPALHRHEQEHGQRFGMDLSPGSPDHAGGRGWALTLARYAATPEKHPALDHLLVLLTHDTYASYQYWSAITLGQMPELDGPQREALLHALENAWPEGRIAAAEALVTHDIETVRALELLADYLDHDEEWVRLYAVTALDALDEKARPVLDALTAAANDEQDKNRYIRDIALRAVEELGEAVEP